MTIRKKRKSLFNIVGIAIVSLWLVMIGLLVKKLRFKGEGASVGPQHVAGNINSPQREWKEIYLKDKKVGYTMSFIDPFDGGYFVQEEIFLRLNLMGLASGVYTATQCRVDRRSWTAPPLARSPAAARSPFAPWRLCSAGTWIDFHGPYRG